MNTDMYDWGLGSYWNYARGLEQEEDFRRRFWSQVLDIWVATTQEDIEAGNVGAGFG